MKWLFIKWLKRYCSTEAGRLEVLHHVHEGVRNEYTEQTPYGNVYNASVEFVMTDPFVNQLLAEKDGPGLKIAANNYFSGFSDALNHIQDPYK